MAESCLHLTVALLLNSLLISQCVAVHATYYVTPSDQCPGLPCSTLSYYTATPDQYFVTGATFVFLPGNHYLRVDGFVVIRDVVNVSLIGSHSSSEQLSGNYLLSLEPTAVITCPLEFSGFAFVNVSHLRISDLGFVYCGAVIRPDLATEALTVQTSSTFDIPRNTTKAALFLVNVHSLDMSSVKIFSSFGYGLLGINVIGDVLIQKCSFSHNNWYTYYTPKCYVPAGQADIHDCIGGNALLVYSDPPECPTSAETYTVRIYQSLFLGGIDLNFFSVYAGTGFGTFLAQKTFGVHLSMSYVMLHGNTGRYGANLFMQFVTGVEDSSMVIDNTVIAYGNALYPPGRYFTRETLHSFGASGAGVQLFYGTPRKTVAAFPDLKILVCEGVPAYKGESTVAEVLTIRNSSIMNNDGNGTGVGISILAPPYVNSELIKRVVTIDGVGVFNNSGLQATGLHLSSQGLCEELNVRIANSVFAYNKAYLDLVEGITEVHSKDFITEALEFNQLGTLTLLKATNVNIFNCRFFGNELSAISATESQISFGGDVLFLGNVGLDGGAINLLGGSVIFFEPHLHMNFIDNLAIQTGGAIYVSDELFYDPECFFQVKDPTFLPTPQLDIILVFENNTALEAGDAVFGGAIDRCAAGTLSGFAVYNQTFIGGQIFDDLAVFAQPNSNSIISSKPERACFCVGGKQDCEHLNISIDLFPGQSFQVTLVALGQRQGVVPATVRGIILPDFAGQLAPLQRLQETKKYCTNLTYTVSSTWLHLLIWFFPDVGFSLHLPPYVVVNFLPCPIGFQLSEKLGICSCSQPLQDRNITCSIEDETVTRESPYWFSATSGELAFHDHCPFDYCRDENVEMNLAEPDTQCAFQRSGTLCGECRNGHSLSLGTSKCQKCTNVYLLLIIPFAIMGVLLVLFLSLLNLTVKVGTIHGLIFYANVVKINQAAFFPSGEVSFFTVFLSWLNLDFGIESCFYDGLDAYTKTWLQFVFPLYIWVIGIAIIVCAHYSTRVSQVFSNAVHILDTLFLLSYTKILRAIITALSFTVLEYQGGREDEMVWLYDGNVKYGEGKHIALIVFGSIFLLLACPYTFILLFAQFLRRYSHKRAFQWVVKIKPFLDAYTGPYKDNHGYWTGLLLLARVVLVLVFAFNVLGNPAVNIMAVTIISFLLAILGRGVYKIWILDALEASFLINLGILSAATMYISEAGGNQQGLVYTSVTIALIEFAVILVCHGIQRLMGHWGKKWPELATVTRYLRHHGPAPGAIQLEDHGRPETEDLFDGEGRRGQAAFKTTYVDISALQETM